MKKFLKVFAIAFAVVVSSVGLVACSCKKEETSEATVELNDTNLVGEYNVTKVVYTPGEENTRTDAHGSAATYTKAQWDALVAKQNNGEAWTQEESDMFDVFEDLFYTYRVKDDHKVYQVFDGTEYEGATWGINNGKLTYVSVYGTNDTTAEWDNGKIIVTYVMNSNNPAISGTYVMTLEKVA